jgi:hypothetical protein
VRYLSSGFINQSTQFGPPFTVQNFFRILFRIRRIELFEFEILTALWATAENQIFFGRCQGFKTWVVLALAGTVNTHYYPFKEYGKLLKNCYLVLLYGN